MCAEIFIMGLYMMIKMAEIGNSGLPCFTALASIYDKVEAYRPSEQRSISSTIVPQDFEPYQNCLRNCNVGYELCMGHVNANGAKCAGLVKTCRRNCMIWCFNRDVKICNVEF